MVSASPDYAASPTTTPDAVSAPEMISEMADVAGAMFSLLLLRTLGGRVEEATQVSALTEPADLPAVLPAPLDPSPASALPVPVPVLDITTSQAAAIAPIAMPASVPVLHYVPEPVAAEAQEYTFPVTASPPPNTAMLSEIGFLDD